MGETKPIVMCLRGALEPEAVENLTAAGYCVLPVASFDQVKIVRTEHFVLGDPIAVAAVETVLASSYTQTCEVFGKKVARALLPAKVQP